MDFLIGWGLIFLIGWIFGLIVYFSGPREKPRAHCGGDSTGTSRRRGCH